MAGAAQERTALRVAVVVVNFNTREHLRRCLHSIDATARTAPFDLLTVVVDNASHDGSAEMVAAEFSAIGSAGASAQESSVSRPDPHVASSPVPVSPVHLLASPQNLGFTGGNNRALHYLGFEDLGFDRVPLSPAGARLEPAQTASTPDVSVKPDYVLLLNPDAELTPGALETLVAFMERTPKAAICGPQLRYGDGTFQHAAFTFPDWRQVALDMSPIPLLPGVRRLWTRLLHSRFNGRYPAQLWQGGVPFAVDFVLGAAMCVRSTAIDAVGGLDEGFFMYCEEMDWCLRMAQSGRRVYAVPSAQVIHHEAQSSRQVRHAAYVRLWRSRLRFFDKHATRYPPLHRSAVRALARLHWRRGRARAWRTFARGLITGTELEAELNAYAELLSLARGSGSHGAR